MKKYFFEGKVGVVVDPEYGIPLDLAEERMDARLVEAVLSKNKDRIQQQYNKIYEKIHGYEAPMVHLEVRWVPVGSKFIIDDYDGAEFLKLESDIDWLEA